MRLTDLEKQMLDGGQGRLKQAAMENTVRYAEILGAEDLCRITRATVFCGAHHYLSACGAEDFHTVFSKMNLALDETLAFDTTDPDCHVQSCVAPCDQTEYASLNQSAGFFNKNQAFLDAAARAGVIIAGTCAPYLTGWLPVRGEHFVTTESGVTMIGNSLWGAMANSDGIEAAFWAAICGRTPRWGNHLPEQRRGTVRVRVDTAPFSILDWDLLGMAIGSTLGTRAVPVVDGDLPRPDFNRLRQFFTSLAVSSNSEICHIAALTPEALTAEAAFGGPVPKESLSVSAPDLKQVYETLCHNSDSEISLVSLGCPHYDIHQIHQVAGALEGKKISPHVHFMVWTPYPVKAMSDLNGYTRIIEQAGGRIYTSTCPVTVGKDFLDPHPAMVFDSLKQAGSAKSTTGGKVFCGDMMQCINAAISGRWQEEMRWNPR